MSMTREEAINRIKDHMKVHHIGEYPHIRLKEALDMALSALRPVSREQVERMRGSWEQGDPYDMGDICCKCGYDTGREPCKWNFCPRCGQPKTDEAVEMVMRRLEALKDE